MPRKVNPKHKPAPKLRSTVRFMRRYIDGSLRYQTFNSAEEACAGVVGEEAVRVRIIEEPDHA